MTTSETLFHRLLFMVRRLAHAATSDGTRSRTNMTGRGSAMPASDRRLDSACGGRRTKHARSRDKLAVKRLAGSARCMAKSDVTGKGRGEVDILGSCRCGDQARGKRPRSSTTSTRWGSARDHFQRTRLTSRSPARAAKLGTMIAAQPWATRRSANVHVGTGCR